MLPSLSIDRSMVGFCLFVYGQSMVDFKSVLCQRVLTDIVFHSGLKA
jgi:hypothetical protein